MGLCLEIGPPPGTGLGPADRKMDGMEEHGEDRHKHLLNQVGTVEVAFQGLHRH